MQLSDFLFATMIGAVAGVLFGYLFFADHGQLDSGTFSIWLNHNLESSVWLWALGGAAVGFVGRYLMVTRV